MMLTHIKQWLMPPVFPGDEQKTNQVRWLDRIVLYIGALLLITALVFVPLFVVEKLGALILLAGLLLGVGFTRGLFFRGYVRQGAWFMLSLSWLIFFIATVLSGGSSPTMLFLANTTIVAGLVLGRRHATGLVLLTVSAGLASVLAPNWGWQVPIIFRVPPVSLWLAYGLGLVFTGMVIDIVVHNLQNALTREHEQDLAREKAELALQQSEQRFEMFMQYFPGLTFIKDSNGITLFANQGFGTLLGLDPQTVIGKSTPAVLGSALGAKLEQDNQVLASGIPQTLEEEFDNRIWQTHKFRINQTNAQPMLGGITLDITEHYRAQAGLRKSEALFRAVVENSFDGILMLGRDRAIKYISPTFARMCGYLPQDLLGTISTDYVHPDDQAIVIKKFDALVCNAGVGISTEYRIIHKQGHVLWLETTPINLLDDPHVQALVLNSRDITERKHAEQALRESQQRLLDASRIAHLGYLDWDLANNHMVWSDETFRIHGYAPNQVVPTPDVTLQMVHPDDRAAFIAKLERAIQEKGSFDLEHRIIRADGKIAFLLVKGQVMCDAQGNPQRVLGTISDMTQHRQTEEQIRQSEITYRGIIDSLAESVYVLDENGTFIDVNQGAERMYGFARDELVGKSPAAVSADGLNDLAQVMVQNKLAFNGTPQMLEFWGKRKNGTIFPKEVHLYPGSYFGRKVIVAIAQDITERKHDEQAIERRNAELTALNEIGQALSQLATPAEILERVWTAIGRVMDNRNLYIALYDQATQSITFPIYMMHGRRLSPDGRTLGNGLTDYIIRTGKSVLIRGDMQGSLRQLGIDLIGTPSHSFVAVPICVDKQVIGVIAHQDYEQENAYDAHHLELLMTIATQAASALENARLYHSVQRELEERTRAEHALQTSEQTARRTAEQLQMVNRIGIAITAGLGMETLMQTVYEQCKQIGDTNTFYVALYDEATATLSYPFNYKDGERRTTPPRQIQNSFSLSNHIIESRQTLYVPDCDQIPYNLNMYRQPGQPTCSFVGVPLVVNEKVKGILSMQSHTRGAYTPEQIHMLELLAPPIALAIQNSQLYDQAHQNEKKYRELFEVNKDGIAIFPMQPDRTAGNFVELNHAAHAMLGYTKQEMLCLTPLMLEPDLTDEQIQARQRALSIQDTAHFETILMHKNGHRVYTEFTAQAIQYEGRLAIMNIVRDITERKQRERELQVIASLSAALRTATFRAEMFPMIVEQIIQLLGCDAATIEMIDPQTGDALVQAAQGLWSPLVGSRQKHGTGLNGIIAKTLQPYYCPDLKTDPNVVYPEWYHEKIRGSVGVPLIAQEQLIGFLWMGHKNDIAPAEVQLISAIANIAANAIHRATLHEQTQQDATDLARAYDLTLAGWVHALELRDRETEGHTRRVVQMAVQLAQAMGIPEDELENIRRGALLHDIGKMGVPDSILLKPGALDKHEWAIMQRHPEYAYNLLAPIEYLHKSIDIPYCHHEKWDGSGYPRKLKGTDIPLAARIFAIVDVWDALNSDRPYQKAWLPSRALEYIASQSGKHFDPRVVQEFLKIIVQE